MDPRCVNLKQRFGDRFKVAYEESYQAEHGPRAWAEDPWLMVVLCQYGEIYPYGDDLLVASTKKAGWIARILKGLAFATLHKDGSDGVDVIFPVDRFEEIAAIMKPRTRRRISEKERKRLLEMSERHSPFRKPPFSGVPQTAQECDASDRSV